VSEAHASMTPRPILSVDFALTLLASRMQVRTGIATLDSTPMTARPALNRFVRPAETSGRVAVGTTDRAEDDADERDSQTQRLVAELSEVRLRMAKRALQPLPTQRTVAVASPSKSARPDAPRPKG
jgi:hypothetical protein